MKATKPFNAHSGIGDVAFFDIGDGIVARVTIARDEFAIGDVLSNAPQVAVWPTDRAAFDRGDRTFVGVTVELECDDWKKTGFQGLWGIEVDWRKDNSPHLNECAESVVSWALDETH